VLFVEDRAEDAELLLRELNRAALRVEWRRVDNLADLESALGGFLPDVILSDYSLPGFGGMNALELARRYLP
jgi:CheY-like chemotaxis protein